jgi:hypothetical protein
MYQSPASLSHTCRTNWPIPILGDFGFKAMCSLGHRSLECFIMDMLPEVSSLRKECG